MAKLLDRFKEEWNVVGIFYFVTLTTHFGFSLTMMIEFIYLYSIGISFLKIGVIYLLFGVIHAVFEIPTGIVADNYGRKISTLIGFSICGLSFTLVPLNESFLYLLILFSGFAFGSTFVSGAMGAWMIDTLKEKGLDDWIHRVSARGGSLTGLVGIPASLIGALALFSFGGQEVLSYRAILVMKSFFLIHGGLFLLNFFVLYLFGEEARVEEDEYQDESLPSYVKRTAKVSSKFIISNRVVLVLMAAIVLFFFSFAVLQDAWQPYLTARIGFRLYWLGIAAAVTSLFGFLVNTKSEEFTEKIGSYPSALLLLTVTLGGLIVLFSLLEPSYAVILLYVLIITLFSFYRPIRGAYLHNNVPSRIRATIKSIDSFLIEVATGLGSLLVFGYIGDFFDLRTALLVGGLILVVSSILYLFLMRE